MAPEAVNRDSRAPWQKQGSQGCPESRGRRKYDRSRDWIIRTAIPLRQDPLSGFAIELAVDRSHHGEEGAASLTKGSVARAAMRHFCHLSGNAAGGTNKRLGVVLIYRLRRDSPEAMRATFPDPEDVEEIIDDAYHQISHQGDPSGPNLSAPHPPLFTEAQVEQV